MTIQAGPSDFKEKELKKDWPVVEGTDFATTKQTEPKYLEPQEGTAVNRVGRGFQ